MLFYRKAGVVVDGDGFAREGKPIFANGGSLEVCGAVDTRREIECAGTLRCELDDDHLVRAGSENLAGVGGAVVAEGGAGDGRVEVELVAVVVDFSVGCEATRGEVEVEIAEGLVTRHAARDGHHVAESEGFGFGDLAGEEELADLRDSFACLRVVAVADIAVPDGLLVELDALQRWVAEDHCAETAVADGEGVGPGGGGLAEVEDVVA